MKFWLSDIMELQSIGKIIEIEGDITKILIYKNYLSGLRGIKDLSEIMILYWDSEPEGKPFYDEKGIFATSYTDRPNPIGVEIVELTTVENNLLIVTGLHAHINDTILDIKPV
jgi:tRNA (Thr-GGU) A37 N-methylase